jgi:hypothetical protein
MLGEICFPLPLLPTAYISLTRHTSRPGMSPACRVLSSLLRLLLFHILNVLTSFISFLCKCHFILKSPSVRSFFFVVVLNSMAMTTDLNYIEKWFM